FRPARRRCDGSASNGDAGVPAALPSPASSGSGAPRVENGLREIAGTEMLRNPSNRLSQVRVALSGNMSGQDGDMSGQDVDWSDPAAATEAVASRLERLPIRSNRLNETLLFQIQVVKEAWFGSVSSRGCDRRRSSSLPFRPSRS